MSLPGRDDPFQPEVGDSYVSFFIARVEQVVRVRKGEVVQRGLVMPEDVKRGWSGRHSGK